MDSTTVNRKLWRMVGSIWAQSLLDLKRKLWVKEVDNLLEKAGATFSEITEFSATAQARACDERPIWSESPRRRAARRESSTRGSASSSSGSVESPCLERGGNAVQYSARWRFCAALLGTLLRKGPSRHGVPATSGLPLRESLLSLIEQDDLHDALDIAPGTPTRPSLGPPPSRPRRDPKTRATRRAPRPITRRRSAGPRPPLHPASPWVRPGPTFRSSPGPCGYACHGSYRVCPSGSNEGCTSTCRGRTARRRETLDAVRLSRTLLTKKPRTKVQESLKIRRTEPRRRFGLLERNLQK